MEPATWAPETCSPATCAWPVWARYGGRHKLDGDHQRPPPDQSRHTLLAAQLMTSIEPLNYG